MSSRCFRSEGLSAENDGQGMKEQARGCERLLTGWSKHFRETSSLWICGAALSASIFTKHFCAIIRFLAFLLPCQRPFLKRH